MLRIVIQVPCDQCCSLGAGGSQGGNVRASKDRMKRGVEVPSGVTWCDMISEFPHEVTRDHQEPQHRLQGAALKLIM